MTGIPDFNESVHKRVRRTEVAGESREGGRMTERSVSDRAQGPPSRANMANHLRRVSRMSVFHHSKRIGRMNAYLHTDPQPNDTRRTYSTGW